MLKVTLRRSTVGGTRRQLENVKGLGLRRIRSSRLLENTPAVRGMIKKVLHLVDVEEVEVDTPAGAAAGASPAEEDHVR